MKNWKIVFSAFMFFFFVFLSSSPSILKKSPEKKILAYRAKNLYPVEWKEGEVLVKFSARLRTRQIRSTLKFLDTTTIERIPAIDVYLLKTPSTLTVEDTIQFFRSRPDVEFAEPNYRMYLASTPNDTYFHYQWGLRNIGQNYGPESFHFTPGTPGADINASDAWDIEKGSENTLVAVIDTGVDLTHPDLINHIYSPGMDYVHDDYDATDDHGHGTNVAGIIAAESNNNLGISGVCWDCMILPVKVFDKDAMGYTSSVVNGIIWAVDQGVRVINMSFGGPDIEVNQTLEDAIIYAYQHNVVLVASAGNQGIEGVWHPAAYDEYVMAISATNNNDIYQTLETTNGAWGSNYGPEVDVAAPGLNILSTWGMNLWDRLHPGWTGYIYGSKTSMSTAFVSGAAALIISFQPSLANWEVMDILRQSADDINAAVYPGQDIYIGHGRINLGRALEMLKKPEPPPPKPDPPSKPDPPLNFSGKKITNHGIYWTEYIHVLTWEQNPSNAEKHVAKYRIYLDERGIKRLLVELDSNTFEYMRRWVTPDKAYTYVLLTVDDKGKEGDPAYVTL